MDLKNELSQKSIARVEIGKNIKNMTIDLERLVAAPNLPDDIMRALSAQLELMAAMEEYFVGDVRLDAEIESRSKN